MPKPISWFQMWLLRRIFKSIVVQSEFHERNITAVYVIMHEEVKKQFSEDNTSTREAFLQDCFNRANRCVLWS